MQLRLVGVVRVDQRQALVEESLRFGALGCDSVVVVAQAWQNRCRSRRSARLFRALLSRHYLPMRTVWTTGDQAGAVCRWSLTVNCTGHPPSDGTSHRLFRQLMFAELSVGRSHGLVRAEKAG